MKFQPGSLIYEGFIMQMLPCIECGVFSQEPFVVREANSPKFFIHCKNCRKLYLEETKRVINYDGGDRLQSKRVQHESNKT